MPSNKKPRIKVKNLGPIIEADVTFGDLTVLVGPQASGKSIFLQTLKLAMDRNHILGYCENNSLRLNGNPIPTLAGFYGRGMEEMLDKQPTICWNGSEYSLDQLTQYKKPKGNQVEKLFYIPAQRVVTLPSGYTQPFGSYRFGDPYVLRYFGDKIHIMLQNEFGHSGLIFPIERKLNKVLREPISRHIFSGAEIWLEDRDFTNMLILKGEGYTAGLPYLAWSAGQREFAPLLFGMYWLCPPSRVNKKDEIEWVVIEEPEMGLHTRGIVAFLLMVLELMKRDYKVIIATHSTTVLDLVWTMREIIESRGEVNDVRKLFDLKPSDSEWKITSSALKKEYRVYFFDRDKPVQDISTLDPGSEDDAVSNWGDLSGFTEKSSDIIAHVVNRSFFQGVAK